MKLKHYREMSFNNLDKIDEFVDALYYKLKQLSPDLDFNVKHGDVSTSIIFSGSNLGAFYVNAIKQASKDSAFSSHNYTVTRRGNSAVINIKH